MKINDLSVEQMGRGLAVCEKTNDGTNTFGRRRDKGDCGMYHHATADRAASNTCTVYTAITQIHTQAITQIHNYKHTYCREIKR